MRLFTGTIALMALASAPLHAEPPPAPPTLATYTIAAEAEHGFPPAQAAAHLTDLQQLLTARGYYAGPADGRMTPGLRTAVSVYQSDVGMRVTGVPDLAVVNMLRHGPEVKATIQPLGVGEKPAPAPVPPAIPVAATITPTRPAAAPPFERPVAAPPYERPVGVPPYERIEPYRPPAHAAKAIPAIPAPPAGDEPPLPKAAPQDKVQTSPLSATVK